MSTTLRRLTFGLLGLALVGCKTGAPVAATVTDPAIKPLPSVETEVLPDGSEVVVAAPADADTGPKTWTQKITAFCVPKTPPGGRERHGFKPESVPYTD